MDIGSREGVSRCVPDGNITGSLRLRRPTPRITRSEEQSVHIQGARTSQCILSVCMLEELLRGGRAVIVRTTRECSCDPEATSDTEAAGAMMSFMTTNMLLRYI